MSVSILFMGNHNIGHDALKMLLARGVRVVAVFAHPEPRTPEETWYRSVKQLAEANKLPVYQPDNLKASRVTTAVKALAPDLILSVWYGKILSRELLSLPRLGAVNLHGSLLPTYRGRFSPIWAVANGERVTGATLHFIDAGIDTGDIIAQMPLAIRESDTGYTLYMRVCATGLHMLEESLPLLLDGPIPRRPQPRMGTYYSAMSDQDRCIRWEKSSSKVSSLVKACFFPPYPSSYTFHRGEKGRVLRVRILEEAPVGRPGEIVALIDDRPVVCTGDGAVLLEESELFAPHVTVGETLG